MRDKYQWPKVDACHVENATCRQQYYRDATAKRAKQMTEDADREKRLAAAECVVCYGGYGGSRIGGSMCTTRPCGVCETSLHSGCTSIDVLCCDCATRLGLCKHCGGDVELKHRRKKRDFTPPPRPDCPSPTVPH